MALREGLQQSARDLSSQSHSLFRTASADPGSRGSPPRRTPSCRRRQGTHAVETVERTVEGDVETLDGTKVGTGETGPARQRSSVGTDARRLDRSSRRSGDPEPRENPWTVRGLPGVRGRPHRKCLRARGKDVPPPMWTPRPQIPQSPCSTPNLKGYGECCTLGPFGLRVKSRWSPLPTHSSCRSGGPRVVRELCVGDGASSPLSYVSVTALVPP